MTQLTPKEVRKAARRAITIFGENNMECCLFGSLACHIWGMTYRDPKDVDLVVLNNLRGRDTEDLKELLVEADDNFYLVASRDPNATYRVLHYRIGPGRSCKVDVLTTGNSTSLNIPRVPVSRVVYIHPYNDMPVMPVLALLLMKLRGWVDHRHSQKAHERAKVRQDVRDVKTMLDIALEEGDHVDDPDSSWMPQWFVRQMRGRVDEFVNKFPESETDWEILGM
ncbi:hypothetical protein C8R42DRAFT_570011 [Lentinula raphanica]|nr:hypothetical protein C8R42DRAFT_570011 [Lentinula raphanica]